LLAGFGAACWGISTVTSKGALEFLPPLTLLVVQLLRSHLLLWTGDFCSVYDRRRLPIFRGLLEEQLSLIQGVGAGLILAAMVGVSRLETD